ncbi:hypothetical protein QQX98_013005 [Neonectria punicea]|uniref:Major facilitator superfamily (MFS) profile domain-containing protein n=1 Tax=Neonectria punicea TaxID=979145 RepID=A0ABR1GHK1_9HYPO
MFISGRMLIGLGIGLAQTVASSYVSETIALRVRPFVLGFAPLYALGLIPFLPESPRRLIYNDRREEALDILARFNGCDRDDADAQLQFREVIDALEYEKSEGKGLGFREIIRNALNRKRTYLALSVAPLTMLTGSNVITYYYGTMLTQAGIKSSKMQMEIKFVLFAWQFVVTVSGSILDEKLGRRMLDLASLGTCTIIFYLTYMVNASWNVLFFIWAFFFWVETKGKTLGEVDELFDGFKHSDVPNLRHVQNKQNMATVSLED